MFLHVFLLLLYKNYKCTPKRYCTIVHVNNKKMKMQRSDWRNMPQGSSIHRFLLRICTIFRASLLSSSFIIMGDGFVLLGHSIASTQLLRTVMTVVFNPAWNNVWKNYAHGNALHRAWLIWWHVLHATSCKKLRGSSGTKIQILHCHLVDASAAVETFSCEAK